MRQLKQSLHFVVFLFLRVLAAEDAPAAPVPLGEVPLAAGFFFFLATRVPAADAPFPALPEKAGRSRAALNLYTNFYSSLFFSSSAATTTWRA